MRFSMLNLVQQWLKVTRTEAIAALLLLGGALVGLVLRGSRSGEQPQPWLQAYFDSVAAVTLTHSVGVDTAGKGVAALVAGDTLLREASLFPTRRKKQLPATKINLNTASFEELQQLPRIGPALARRIIEYRSRHPFRRIEEIMRVRGIGRITFERLRPYITVGETEGIKAANGSIGKSNGAADGGSKERRGGNRANVPEGSGEQKSSSEMLTQKGDLNTATEEELIRLPGIGPVLARRIIEYRQRHPFRNIEEIQRVKGIGPKKFAKLKPWITVNK